MYCLLEEKPCRWKSNPARAIRSIGRLSGLMEASEPYIKRAYVFSHSNIYMEGRIIYVPIYMLMFVKRGNDTLGLYSLDLSGL